MKKIEAIIRVSKFKEVQDALHNAGIHFFTYLEVKGVGKEKKEDQYYRGNIYDSGFIPRYKLEIVVQDAVLPIVVRSILENASTGQIGDGKIFVIDIETGYRIKNGEEIVGNV